jgi:hypothetical protein
MSPRNNWDKYINEMIDAGSTTLREDVVKMMDLALLACVSRRTGGDVGRMAGMLGMSVEELERKIEELGRGKRRRGGNDGGKS